MNLEEIRETRNLCIENTRGLKSIFIHIDAWKILYKHVSETYIKFFFNNRISEKRP